MRRRLAFLVVMSSVAAGCSLLVEFDRGKLGSLEALEDAATDATQDVTADGQTADGAGDVTQNDVVVQDAPVDSPTDAPADANDAGPDAPIDAPADTRTDANDAAPDAPVDSAVDTGTDAAVDTGVDAAPDAGLSAYCTQAEFDANDATGNATVTITFPETATPAQYTPSCVKIKEGTVVTFHGSFASHPLTNAGGTPGNPIPAVSSTANDAGDVGDLDVTFANAGTYDFKCGNHPLQMNGGIQVVP